MYPQTTRRCSTQSDDEYNNLLAFRPSSRTFDPYHREYKANKFDRDGYEVFMKDNPVAFLALEPRDVDHLLYTGVSIFML